MASLGKLGRPLKSTTLGELRPEPGRPAPGRPSAVIAGTACDGTAERARLVELGRRALPRYPGTDVIPAVVIPPPPLLDDRMNYTGRVRHLATGYRGALMAVYRKRSFFMLTGTGYPPCHKDYGRLADAAMLLFEAKIAPAAWCLFSFSIWKVMEHTRRPPTVKWVFSCERFESQREWYESERTRWARRIERPVREHLELGDRWKRMWADLLRKRPPDRPRLLAILDEHFPGDSYERAVECARKAAWEAQVRIDRRIAAGEIPWIA